MSCLQVTVGVLPITLASTNISRADKPITVSCSVVCSIKELKNYLKVSPNDVQWITSDVGVIYNVESDMDWVIVTN